MTIFVNYAWTSNPDSCVVAHGRMMLDNIFGVRWPRGRSTLAVRSTSDLGSRFEIGFRGGNPKDTLASLVNAPTSATLRLRSRMRRGRETAYTRLGLQHAYPKLLPQIGLSSVNILESEENPNVIAMLDTRPDGGFVGFVDANLLHDSRELKGLLAELVKVDSGMFLRMQESGYVSFGSLRLKDGSYPFDGSHLAFAYADGAILVDTLVPNIEPDLALELALRTQELDVANQLRASNAVAEYVSSTAMNSDFTELIMQFVPIHYMRSHHAASDRGNLALAVTVGALSAYNCAHGILKMRQGFGVGLDEVVEGEITMVTDMYQNGFSRLLQGKLSSGEIDLAKLHDDEVLPTYGPGIASHMYAKLAGAPNEQQLLRMATDVIEERNLISVN